MVEQTNIAEGLQDLDNGLDLSGLNEPMDALGAFNMEQLEPPAADPGPGDPVKPVTKADLIRTYEKRMQQTKQLATVGIPQMAEDSRNKFQAARVVEFDAKKFNVDRYLGYGKETFNKVGFSPFVDNEKNFNANTNIWQDYGRMISVFGGLAYEGGASGYRSIGSLIKGDDFFTPDDLSAENFARAQNIGMSTREGGLSGAGAWVNNFVLNSAYTAGVAFSILAEEALLFGATALSEGAFGGVAAMRTAANTARFGRAVKQAYNTQAVGNIAKGSVQLIKSLSKVGDAKDFYTAVKAGSRTLGKGTLQYINPLTRTTDDIIDLARGSSSVRNVSNLAKAKRVFGSFYRDVRDTNLALSESKLEGGSARLDKVNELLSEYEKKNGRPADGEDLERIYQQAEDTGYGVTAVNFPIIYLTNRVVLDGLFKFRGFKTLDEAADMASQGIGFKKGTGYYDALSDGWLKNTKNKLLNPKAYIGQGFTYFRRNLFEGIQENLQNVTSDAVGAYYDGVYKDPTLGGLDFAAGNAMHALGQEFTSARGFETFVSGFLMGGFMGKAQNLFLRDVPQVYYWSKDKIGGTNKLEEYKLNKIKTRQNAIDGLNELYKNPLKYFSTRNESAVVQKHSSDVMNQAEDAGDAKTFQDAKDLKMFDHVFTALDNGNFSGLISNYKELQKLDNKDLADFLGVQDAGKAPEKLQEIIARAEQIKSRYEAINNQFKNPFTPNKINRNSPEFVTEAIAFRSFEAAKKTAISSQYGFDRAVERMNSLYSDLATNRPVKKASSSDITVLTDIETLNSEINLLEKEVQSYNAATDPEQKKIGEQKQAKLDRMMDYRDKLRTHLDNLGSVETEENGQIKIQFGQNTVDPLKESYKSYLREIAKLNNDYNFENQIDESFVKLLDYYNLNQDARNYNQVVNTLLDPANLYRHAERLNSKLTDLFENRNADINERVERGQRIMELSEMLKALAVQGVMLDPKELQEFIRTGKKPTSLIDAATLKDLDPSSPKYAAAQAILDIDDAIKTTPVPPVTETKKEEEPVAPTTKPTVVEEQSNLDMGIEPELQTKLQDAYNQYLEEQPDSEITFENFVKTSPRAARVKALFNKEKAQAAGTEPVTTSPTVAAPASDIEETGNQLQVIHMMYKRMESLSKEEKTLMDKYYDVLKAEGLKNGKELSELYYKVKKDGSNPELVKQVDELLLEVKKLQSAPVVTDAKADVEKARREEVLAAIPTDEDLVISPEQFDRFDREGNSAKEGSLSGKDIEFNIEKELERRKKENENLTGRFQLENRRYFRDLIPKLEEILAKVKAINAKYDQGLTTEAAPVVEEKTGSQKAQELIDSVSSIKDLPDLNRADSRPITIDLTELISTGQAKSKDINQMLNKKRKELLQNISTKDLQKGDIVTFVDGKKGFVRSVGNNEVSIKVTGSQQGVVEVVPASNLSKTISNIESGKLVSMEPTPDIEVTPQEITEVKASQDAKSAFTENTAAVKEAAEKAAKAAGTNNQQNLNNLLQNIGCKTGK
jgi:hypothetical protein